MGGSEKGQVINTGSTKMVKPAPKATVIDKTKEDQKSKAPTKSTTSQVKDAKTSSSGKISTTDAKSA